MPTLSEPPQNSSTHWTLPTNCSTYNYHDYEIPSFNPDIHPGKYSTVKFSKLQWTKFGYCFGGNNDLDYIYEQGVKDAQAWYEQEQERKP